MKEIKGAITMEWSVFRTAVRDPKIMAAIINAFSVSIGLILGAGIASWIDLTLPYNFLSAAACILVLRVIQLLAKMIYRHEHTLIAPLEGESYQIEFQDDGQVIWKAEMEDGSIEEVPLFRGDFQVVALQDHYALCGQPSRVFVQTARAAEMTNQSEFCYAITKLHIFFKKELAKNAELDVLLKP